MDGQMFRYSEEDKNLIGFVSLNTSSRTVCSSAVILVPGLTDGFMSMNYTQHLSKELIAINFSLVQVNLSSSFYQFGISSLQNDSKELTQLVKYIRSEYNFQKMFLLGSSTGTQDALWFAEHSEACKLIDGFILQAPISDRDVMAEMDSTQRLLEEARRLRTGGSMDSLLSEKFEGAPITAYRYLSLAERLGDDDMFSVDLTMEELKRVIPKVPVPIALCYSAEDEYVPNMEGLRETAKRLSTILEETSPKVDVKYFSGDHGLSKPEYYIPFVEYVCHFVSTS
jgi:alpha-beta hydrolase superfamily lysophospholipase